MHIPRDDEEHPGTVTVGKDWSTEPDGGFSAFQAARERHFERLRRESEIFRLEEVLAASEGG